MNFSSYLAAFLYDIKMCAGANIIADINNKTDLHIIPLKRKMNAGIIDNDKDLNKLFFLKQIRNGGRAAR